MTVLKPFFLVACVAFVTGFAGYCAWYRLQAPALQTADAPPLKAQASDPAPAPDPDLASAKRI